MRINMLWNLAGLVLICMTIGCVTDKKVVELSGTPGAAVSGYYIRSGRRIDLNGNLPITLQPPGITLVAVKKVNPADTLVANAHESNGEIWISSPAGKAGGVRLDLGDGFTGGAIDADEALAPLPNQELLVIKPYWHNGTWVFDDAAVGLQQEPFVQGVPEIIDRLTKDVPHAREGFRLTFSAREFPGSQAKLSWVRSESGGNVYRLDNPRMEGWLCPALFRYFREAPRNLYVRAESVIQHGGTEK